MSDQFRMFDSSNLSGKVVIAWRMETARDDSGDKPDDNDDGFWPSRDPKACGYVRPADFDKAQEAAEARMEAWQNDEWEFIGVVAVAEIAIPIGGESYVTHTLRSAGVWGIESDAGDYLATVFAEEKAELLAQLKTLGVALEAGDFEQKDV